MNLLDLKKNGLAAFFLIFTFCSCLSIPQKKVPLEHSTWTPPPSPSFATLTNRYKMEAISLDSRKEYYEAYLKWKIIAEINPKNTSFQKAGSRSKQNATQSAKKHYASGLQLLSKNSLSEARQQFLLTLTQDPTHSDAHSKLKKMMWPNDFFVYKTPKKNTLPKIAKEVYQEDGLAYLIAFFNDLDPSKGISKGTTLLLPQKKLIVSLHNKRVILSKKENKKSIDSLFQKALIFFEKGEFGKSLDTLKTLPEVNQHSDWALLIEKIKKKIEFLKNEASKLYYQGKVNLAIKKWQTILSIDPKDKTSTDNIESITSFQEAIIMFANNQFQKARELTTTALANNLTRKDAEILLKKMLQKAEEHFKEGVKDFINDMIESAIQNWEVTLLLNPEHVQAKEYFRKGEKLLQKLNAIK